MAFAVQLLENHPAQKAIAEKRYLNWIRARLNNPNASLSDFVAANPRKALINQMLSRNIAKNFISLSYFDDAESKFVVDFIGSMIQNVMNIDQFIAEAKTTTDLSSLEDCYNRYAKSARAAILEEAKQYPDGWMSKAMQLVFGLPICRLLFEKTKFDLANTSIVLREFMFFWNMSNEDEYSFDIFQSDVPKLTEVFWLLPQIPDTVWGDTQPKFPESPLSFSRKACYKVGDDGSWTYYKKP